MRIAILMLALLGGCQASAPPADARPVKFIERADGIWEVHIPRPGGMLVRFAHDEKDAMMAAGMP